MTTVRLLQVRYAASPDGPWGEPELFEIYDDGGDAALEWSEPKRNRLQVFRGYGEYFQKRLVEYVPLSPAPVDEPPIAKHLREWPSRVHQAATHYLKHDEVRELNAYIDALSSSRPSPPDPSLLAPDAETLELLDEYELALSAQKRPGRMFTLERNDFANILAALSKAIRGTKP